TFRTPPGPGLSRNARGVRSPRRVFSAFRLWCCCEILSSARNKLFDKAEEISGYSDLKAQRDAARAEGRLVGLGVSGCIEASGPAPSQVAVGLGAGVGLWESGIVRVHPLGKVTVMTGSHSHGQGHETAFAQIVADELGIDIGDVEVLHGDTGRTPFGLGTYGSRSASVGGSALVVSCQKIRDKMKRIAAHQLEAAVEDMVYDRETGTISVKGSPDQNRGFVDICVSALTADIPAGMEPGLEESTFYDPANFTFPNSAHISLVEVDRETGEVEILHYTGVDDVGNVINPMIVEGQLQGGIAQGVGQALLEHGIYDDDGQLLTGSMLDYAMPRADVFPMSNLGRTETPSPHNPLGVKGCGEMGTIAATVTVANAVMDAIGARHLNMPHTANQLHAAIAAD
ncbi:MAG: molybdopterin cofactor-binding domain-containing protein, partial [Pseudomonadota bacterium]